MKKEIIILTFASIILCSFLLIRLESSFEQVNEKSRIKELIYDKAKDQSSNKRVFKNIKNIETKTSKNLVIYRSDIIREHENKVIVCEYSSQEIFILDTQLNLIKKIDCRKGSGPGEFQNFTDYTVNADNLYVCDPMLNKISIFDLKSGLLVNEIKLKNPASRLTILEDKRIVTLSDNQIGQPYLTVYDNKNTNKPIKEIFLKEKIKSLNDDMIITSGSICHIGKKIIVSYRFMDLFYSYDLETEEQIFTKSIEPLGVTEMETLMNGLGFKVPKNVKYSSLIITNTENLISVLSISKTSKDFFIDYYNSNLEYQYSVLINDYKYPLYPIKQGFLSHKDEQIYQINWKVSHD